MKQAFKKTYDQITISNAAEERIVKLYRSSRKHSRIFHQLHIRRLAFAAVIMLVCIPAVSVFASSDFFNKTFGNLFGSRAEILRGNSSLPEVIVQKNSFSDLDIQITGITGDKHIIYVAMDITKTDGGCLDLNYYKFGGGVQLEKYLDYNDDSVYIGSSCHWVKMQDNDSTDNKVSIAYVAEMEIHDNDELVILPGQTFYLRLDDFIGNSDYNDEPATSKMVSKGTWEGEFAIDYDPASTLSFDINTTAKMPVWGTSDKYGYETPISDVELSPLALRYKADFYNRCDEYWICMYIEMKDGSIAVGHKTYESYLDSTDSFIKAGPRTSFFGGVNYDFCWIFGKPVDVSQVKAIHIGDLEINVQ